MEFRAEVYENETVCNCSKYGTFGEHCQYELITAKDSFEATVKHQFNLKSQFILGSQHFGNITCYHPHLKCDSGLLCLDWRNICDNKQNCLDGTDEENCEQLEFNECALDEYRCSNGMCIPEEYFLDGNIHIYFELHDP
ncbi:unnamed protein product [Didymodactylos carnosus]|uniref:Uncharacterized protein n=1 Tax=Didymodactylos carnosus TaxID=1234261 RepID=A0A8S2ESF1_9BILA|nr:unnamed protein product [Didymodactylos carnosus]CAF4033266.1 unnamed protein product [Didymodactylos carnosus]